MAQQPIHPLKDQSRNRKLFIFLISVAQILFMAFFGEKIINYLFLSSSEIINLRLGWGYGILLSYIATLALIFALLIITIVTSLFPNLKKYHIGFYLLLIASTVLAVIGFFDSLIKIFYGEHWQLRDTLLPSIGMILLNISAYLAIRATVEKS